MKLTIDQIQYIDTYVEKSGIEWFDLKIELVDHLVDATAQILEDNPEIAFEVAVTKAKLAFGTKGFRPLITSKTNQLNKNYYKRVFNYLVSFFTFPKIILSLFLIYFLIKTYQLIDDKMWFYDGLTIVLFLFSFRLFFFIFKRDRIDGKKHLALNAIKQISMIVCNIAIFFQLGYTLFSEKLFEGENYIFFTVLWVFAFLFCVALEVISNRIYKDQKALYYQYKITV